MRILFVVPYAPNRIRVRPYNLIKQLTARGHEVTVLTLWSTVAEQRDVLALAEYCHCAVALPLQPWRSFWNCLRTLPTGYPLQSRYCWQPALARQAIALLAAYGDNRPAFDIVHVEHLRGAPYGLYTRRHISSSICPPLIWDSVDCITHLFQQAANRNPTRLRRWLAWFEGGRTARFEGRLTHQFDQVLVTSEADKQALLDLDPRPNHAGLEPTAANRHIHVLPNGVDLDYFQPGALARDPATLVVSGKMSYHANIAMVLSLLRVIMPRVWAVRPDVKVCVVGKDPSREIIAAADHPNVTVTGTVEDIRPYLLEATLAVAPIEYGVGIQNKVLEAMACGTPVVATPQACAALATVPGRDLMVAEQHEAFAEAILSLLDSPAQAQELGEAGRRYTESQHSWTAVGGRLEEMYLDAIERQLREVGTLGQLRVSTA